MAANKLNIDEAQDKVQKIGTIAQNLDSALTVIRSFSEDLYARSNAAFVQEIQENVNELGNIVKQLIEAHDALNKAFGKYAEEYSGVAARL